MTRKRPYTKYLKLVAKDGRAVDETAAFSGDMLLNELDEIVVQLRRQPTRNEVRDRAIIAAWLANLSGRVQ
jgi:hypothetical protein